VFSSFASIDFIKVATISISVLYAI